MNYFKFILVSVFFSTSLFAINSKDMPAIVPVDWLKKNINNPKLVIVDVQPKDKYLKGHIKGAVNMPALKTLFDEKFLMPKLDTMKDRLSDAGIDKDSLVVVYDSGAFMWAARLYWILEHLGHKNVGLLKAGYGAWEKNELPVSTVPFKAQQSEFIPRINNDKIKTKLDTLLAIGKKTIIDGRRNLHFKGKESLAKRFGHIPSAKNYACTQNYEITALGNKMKNLNDLKSVYKDLPKNKEIIAYCDGGAEAALNYIVLQELGYKVAVYDGSWLEWGNDSSVPIVNPSKK